MKAFRSPLRSSGPMTAEERKVIIASSAGTVFEWYDSTSPLACREHQSTFFSA